LNDCLAQAWDKEDRERERKILAIIQHEKDKSFWQRLNYVMRKPPGGSVRRVLVEDEEQGTLTGHLTQELVQKAIFHNIHQKWFFLVEAVPACNSLLRGLFGYNSVMNTAQRILNGTYSYPEEFDQATKEICKECTCIRLMVPKDSAKLSIMKEDWKQQWKGKQESTSSSESGLHFGHYIAGCEPHCILSCIKSYPGC
jgi:hypothetical protein